MPADSPEEICRLFRQYVREGDLESVLTLYDPEAVFLNQSGELKEGREGLKEALAPLASARTIFDFNIKQVIRSGDIALMHTRWEVSGPEPLALYAIEVARRQPDGTWRWLIGDPFTAGREAAPTRALAPSAAGARAIGAEAAGAQAVGALAIGAAALGALAVGRLAVGRLRIARAQIGSLEIEELHVKRLQADDLAAPPAATRG